MDQVTSFVIKNLGQTKPDATYYQHTHSSQHGGGTMMIRASLQLHDFAVIEWTPLYTTRVLQRPSAQKLKCATD